MGCGASSSRITAVDSGKVIDAGSLTAMAKSLLKPLAGGKTSDVVQGAPSIPETSDVVQGAPSIPGCVENSDIAAIDAEGIAAESIRQATIVKGLADTATALITLNPVAAAGLAMAAADVAEAMPPGSGPEAAEAPANNVASGFASSALAAAQAGSAVAAGLTEAAIGTALHVAQARSKMSKVVPSQMQA